MAESLPVVTVPGDDGVLGSDAITAEDIVVLHEVVVEELLVVEGFESIDTTPFAVVTEPSEPSELSEPSAEDVIVIGSSGEEEGEEREREVVERVADGPPRGGMAAQAGIHPVTVPSEMPIDDVPPDETIPAFPVEEETASETQDPTHVKWEGAKDEIRVVRVVEEVVTTVEGVEVATEDVAAVEEVVTTVEDVEVATEDVAVVEEVVTTVEDVEVATEDVTVGEEAVTTVEEGKVVKEDVTVNETVVEAMETEGEKGEKKRLREDVEEAIAKKLKSEEEEGEEAAAKKLRSEEKEEEEVAAKKLKSEEEEKVVEPKKLGPKVFSTPVEMFSYFYNLLHDWNLDLNVNKYEFLVLSELVSQGNPQKVGNGISAFQVRLHPKWQSRCFYVIYEDGSDDDFSYRKCCDALMPLPKSLYRKNGELNLEKLFPGQKPRHHKEQQQNGGGRGGGRGDHRGGRGGRFGARGRGGRGGGGGRRGGRGRW